jgi:hypothetical protein
MLKLRDRSNVMAMILFRHHGSGSRTALALTIWGLLAFGSAATAAEPTAIVEDVTAPGANLAFMDYLFPGRVIDLKSGETITLGYLHSCLRETITGGHIVIGSQKSAVKGGTLKRERVECDGGAMKLNSEQSGKGLVMVLRAPPASSGMPKPALEIFGTSPFFKFSSGKANISIERLDRQGHKLAMASSKDYIDMAASGRTLKPGGLYRARSGERQIVFKVSRFAEPGAGPIIGRLIAF